jgi:hypothetical protein
LEKEGRARVLLSHLLVVFASKTNWFLRALRACGVGKTPGVNTHARLG